MLKKLGSLQGDLRWFSPAYVGSVIIQLFCIAINGCCWPHTLRHSQQQFRVFQL